MKNLDKIIDLDKKILKCYLKPDIDKPNHFLYNTENSINIFHENKEKIFNFTKTILTKEDKVKKDTFIIKSYDLKSLKNEYNYKECLCLGEPYEETLLIQVDIIKKSQKKSIPLKPETVSTISSFMIQFKIPIYIKNGGDFNDKISDFPVSNEIGGFFIGKNSIKKYVVFRQERICTWLRYNLYKINKHHGSIDSFPLKFINPLLKPQYLIIDITMALNKLDIIISSKRTLPEINLIAFICFLTRLNLDNIKDFLLSRFMHKDKYYDSKTVDIINILMNKTKTDLSNFATTKSDDENKKNNYETNTDAYIIKNILYFIKTERKEAINEQTEFETIIDIELLPTVVTLYDFLIEQKLVGNNVGNSRYAKGMTLLHSLENMIIASFQNQIYPDKYNLANKRISSPGQTFETIGLESMGTLIKDITEQMKEELKKDAGSDNDMILKPNRKVQNAYNNVMNLQDDDHSIVVKPQKTINYAQRFMINNLVVSDSSIKLSKYFKSRDPNIITWHYMGPVDTPDHSDYVGINRRLSVGTILSDKNYESSKILVKEIYDFTIKFLNEHSKIKNKPVKNSVSIILVDDSESWIGFIEQSLVKKFYNSLLETKRQNKFESNLIDISLVPYYMETPLKLLFPIQKYRVVRINIGNKIPFMPAYILKDGKLLLEEIINKISPEEIYKKGFKQLIQEYEFMEYIGPEQLLYSSMCENISEYFKLDESIKKRYDYVSFDNILNLGITESLLFDIGKMPGARAIFATSQVKNHVSSVITDSINVIELSKVSIMGIQEPCITNDVLLESSIPKQSFGTHINVAFFSLNHNIEDSVVVNKESVDNGMFLIISTSVIKGEIDFKNLKNNLLSMTYFNNSYKKLDSDSVPELNTVLEKGDALYGNVGARFKKSGNTYYLKDESMPYTFLIPGRVDRIRLPPQETTVRNITYSVLCCHFAERGHKLSNRNAQKVTISKIAQSYELPYNSHGIRPDLCFNSLSIINRKTMNMYNEVMLTNLFSMLPYDSDGKKQLINCKSFSNINYETIQEYKQELYKELELEKEIIDKRFNCNETLYDPLSGERLKYDVFMGPIYFTRLTQISDEKISARNRGRSNKLNQPPSGKQKGGSHRLGEMEVDILTTHGCSNILYEISHDSIELQQYTFICKNCTGIAIEMENNGQVYYNCINCSNIGIRPNLERHSFSKVTKMLMALLGFRGIKMVIKYNKEEPLFSSQISKF